MKEVDIMIQWKQFSKLEETSDGMFRSYPPHIHIYLSNDRKAEFVVFEDNRCLVGIRNMDKITAYYPLSVVNNLLPIQAVLLDLDGTSIKSEAVWIDVLRRTVAKLTENDEFHFFPEDVPYISGHSVIEHLTYCLEHYCDTLSDLNRAEKVYYQIVDQVLSGNINEENTVGFCVADGLLELLHNLNSKGIKTAFVTSGNIKKAETETMIAFRKCKLGQPRLVVDSFITSGILPKRPDIGTAGELIAKPHPWLYAEASRIGLGLNTKDTGIIGVEDSGAGVLALRLAGIPVIGLNGGNIRESGYESFCELMANSLYEVNDFVDKNT